MPSSFCIHSFFVVLVEPASSFAEPLWVFNPSLCHTQSLAIPDFVNIFFIGRSLVCDFTLPAFRHAMTRLSIPEQRLIQRLAAYFALIIH